MYFDTDELDNKLAERIKKKKLHGVSVCIRGPQGIVFEKGYGNRDINKTKPIDGDTIFGIASLSKSMTALACAILATEGKLSFDDPVYKYIPNFEVPEIQEIV